MRRMTRRVRVGDVIIGGGAPVVVQGMTKTRTTDVAATVRQIEQMAREGCRLVRLAIPDREAVDALREIRRLSPLPLVADVHFDYRLALACLDWVDKLRINPGNLGGEARLRQVCRAVAQRGIPLRVGVNAGSLERDLLRRHGGPTPEALVASALRAARLAEEEGVEQLVLSAKASSAQDTIRAYRLLAENTEWPLHVGVTAAGPLFEGLVRSALALGTLLQQGIGDTLRVSLTADPRWEIRAAYWILEAAGVGGRGVVIISCPTCGRCPSARVRRLAREVKRRLADLTVALRVAVMGCAVNGPGEAREADVGLALADDGAWLFERGRLICRVRGGDMVEELCARARQLAKSGGG